MSSASTAWPLSSVSTSNTLALHKRPLLKFGLGNSKLSDTIATFSIPSGFSCPGALECLAKVPRDGGHIVDGPKQRMRCFSAVTELARPTARKARWHNFDLLQSVVSAQESPGERVRALQDLLLDSMHWIRRPAHAVRIHVGGDFYSQEYFDAWMQVAVRRPDLHFYAYTKSIPFWIDWAVNRDLPMPDNTTIVASRGGRYDRLIDRHGLRECVVVDHPEEAQALGLEVDHDDSLAQDGGVKKFALVLHGMQPKGTKSAAALTRMRREGVKFSYSKLRPPK